MTTLNTSLNFNFASSEAARIAQGERAAQETIANQLRQSASGAAFVAGTTITARYQYRVAADGSLVPLQTQITTDAPADAGRVGDRRNGRAPSRNNGERLPTLANLLRPRANLSPSDEVALFAVRDNAVQAREVAIQQSQAVTASITRLAQASDENGDAVEAEVITLRSRGEDIRQQRAQVSVAGLYARNNDIVYNVTPISRLAA